MALAVALAGTFLLRSMVLCAVPTFLAPAFPTRDSLPESRCKSTTLQNMKLSFGQEIFQNPNTESMILKDFEIDIHQILAKQSQNKEIPLESGTSCKATTQTNKRDSVPLAGRLSFL